jgi:hypothetical protein
VANEAQVANEKLAGKDQDETDFRRQADQALMALDNEYRRAQVARRNRSASMLLPHWTLLIVDIEQ